MKKSMTPLERKLAMLSADMLPFLGTAIGAAAGGVGAPVGGALGNIASLGIKGFIPPEEQQRNQMMDRPMVVGGHGQGFIDLDQQQQMMQQPGMGMDQFGGMLGQGLGQLGGMGIMGLLSMLGGQQQPTANQSLFGKMDDSLREKLARMVALKQALGQ
jgi:hypothetical protein